MKKKACEFDFLTVDQAAERVGVSRTAVYEAVREGKLPHVRLLNRIALRPADIDAHTFAPPNGERKDWEYGERSKTKKAQES